MGGSLYCGRRCGGSAVGLGVQQLHNLVICSGELFLSFRHETLAFAPQSRDSFASRRLDPDPTRYERAALRWLQPFNDERLPPLTEVALAASALTELHDPEAIELFITEEDAKRALEDCLRDEPDWQGLLWVEEIELAGMLQSAN
jgi:hypothetical protein